MTPMKTATDGSGRASPEGEEPPLVTAILASPAPRSLRKASLLIFDSKRACWYFVSSLTPPHPRNTPTRALAGKQRPPRNYGGP